MATQKRVSVLTYNGLDGACAAAMVLLGHPKADLVVTSAARIAQSLREVAAGRRAPDEVHVCGLGVWCDWDELAGAAHTLGKKGAEILWYCGRGYLKDQQDKYKALCTPVFLDAGSNAEAVCDHLGLKGHPNAEFLLRLALSDPIVTASDESPPGEEGFWYDLIYAAVARYFKYQDADAYRGAIRKLSRLERDASDEREVALFRRHGFRYALEGRSECMKDLRRTIRKCAELDEPVLITGETGVGKEYVAHLVHEGSRRGMGPIVPVNCAVFTGNVGLANSVLFGHKKGAFTGALSDREGAFVAADSGVLFLDEVGELPVEVQAKLLRVLEDGAITPEGADSASRQVDVRVIAATNCDLGAMIRAGEFRSDLYHRLDVLRIDVRPLREHPEDILAIAERTLRGLEGAENTKLTKKEVQCLQRYDWPGNVRQLIKVLKRYVYLGTALSEAVEHERSQGSLQRAHVAGGDEETLFPAAASEVKPIREIQRQYAVRALELNGGNLSATADLLGIAPNTLRSYTEPSEA